MIDLSLFCTKCNAFVDPDSTEGGWGCDCFFVRAVDDGESIVPEFDPPHWVECDRDIEEIRALSLWNPWAFLMATKDKEFETRSWATAYRGLVIIHAAKKADREIALACRQPEIRETLIEHGIRRASDLPYGAAIAVGYLDGIYSTDLDLGWKKVSDRERAFGNYSPRRCYWEFKDVYRFVEPVPMRGYQGPWNPFKDEALREPLELAIARAKASQAEAPA